MTETVFLCFDCGQRNRVPDGQARAAAKCGSCGKPLFPDAAGTQGASGRTSTRQTSSGQTSKGGSSRQGAPSASRRWGAAQEKSNPARPKPNRKSSSGGGAWKPILGTVAVCATIFYIIVSQDNDPYGRDDRPQYSGSAATAGATSAPTGGSANTPASAPAADPLPPAQPRLPAGILVNATGRTPQAPFEIRTSPGEDYYVKLVDLSDVSRYLTIFVHGGQTLEVEVPLGTYEMRYASGETWRGLEHLFGPGGMTSYNASDDTFNFNISGGYVNGYTVELIRQVGGNMDTYEISPGAF